MKKQMMFKTKGMNLDLSVSAFNPEFAFENMNLRLSTNEGNTTMSWVNERGTSLMSIIINTRPDIKGKDRLKTENDSELVEVGKDKYTSTEIEGIPIGTAVINHQLVLFTSLIGVNGDPNIDRIYVISKILDEEGSTLSNGLTWETLPEENATYILQGTLLCELDLNFSPLYPIETIVSYESNAIQKVYWTDGKNQPRMINIAKDITEPYKSFSFDFIGELQLNEEVTVLKIVGGNGAFPAGVIQYAFTYYLMNGLESNIFYTTPLLYISPRDRGGRPDEKVDNVFKITIDKLDTNYDYLRIYSIIRTSLNSTPLCKRILDVEIETLKNPQYEILNIEDLDYGLLDGGISATNVDIKINDVWRSVSEYYDLYNLQVNVPTFAFYVDSNNQNQDLTTLGYDRAYIVMSEEAIIKISNDSLNLEPKYITYKNYHDKDRLYILEKDVIDLITLETYHEYKVIAASYSTKVTSDKRLLPYIYNISNEPKVNRVTYLDTGYSGDSIDPTELLYKGGKNIIAKTLEQKDGTLFLGNLKIKDYFNSLQNLELTENITLELSTRTFTGDFITSGNYAYYNLLTSYLYTTFKTVNSVPCAGFKRGNYYRFGVLFQDKTGRWSSPIFIKDEIITNTPSIEAVPSSDPIYNKITVPIIKGTLDRSIIESLILYGYKKVRGVVVYPESLDRVVVCLTIGNSTISDSHRETVNGTLSPVKGNLRQSSWFFRPNISSPADGNIKTEGTVSPKEDSLLYMNGNLDCSPDEIRATEILGDYTENALLIEKELATLNSPDVQFNEEIINADFNNTKYVIAGRALFTCTSSEIDIQTETPTINGGASGFIKKTFDSDYSYGIVAGPFYQDYILDDWSDKIAQSDSSKSFVGWMVYPWLRTGSLNNDITRPANMGVLSALLKKKVISNYRYSKTEWKILSEGQTWDKITYSSFTNGGEPKLFYSDELSIIKFSGFNYLGNIDTLLSPSKADGLYFNFNNTTYANNAGIDTAFTEDNWWKTSAETEADQNDPNITNLNGKIKHWEIPDPDDPDDSEYKWQTKNFEPIGDHYKEVCIGKYPVRMRYKSTPHLVALSNSNSITTSDSEINAESTLPIVEVVKLGDEPSSDFMYYRHTMFGGTSLDALKENIWIPCGEPVSLGDGSSDVEFEYSYGDTYFQRWDCMKTYPFTPEDLNQIIEIGSFMLETYMNIDGRYDRNRGLLINVSPQNYNLLNPVYTQRNNFFSYKYLQDTNSEKELYLNLITWTKTKESGADVDLWTNITLASILELDGDKGEINKLIRFNDLLLAFQDTGISLILYNESVQVSTENGIPVELANSGKVLGKRYLSDTVGCTNKWSMTITPSGIYFIDSHDRSIYLFNEGLTNISLNGGMDSWCKNNITLTKGWNPRRFLLTGILSQEFVSYYDRNNKDVLFINGSTALAYSEKLGTFTSFYSYGGAPYLCTLDDLEIWININRGLTESSSADAPQFYLWLHQGSDKHCKMFEADNPYYTVLIGNPEPIVDKTFTNLDFRACVQGDGESLTNNGVTSFRNFYLPFDNIEVWNEYQHGISQLNMTKGRSLSIHNYINPLDAGDTPSPLSRKFRIWRCDIPRDNYPTGLDVKEYETAKGITRFKSRPLDRIRNPWVYIKLTKNISTTYLPKAEIHDVVLTYFD